MTAGKGIVHAEMPKSHTEASIGFQLWINLSKEKKLNPAKYQEMAKEQIPVHQEEGIRVVVISGSYKETVADIQPESTAHYYDVHLAPGKKFDISIPQDWNGLIYPYKGEALGVNGEFVGPDQVVQLLGNGDELDILNTSVGEAKFILIFGKPLNQPIAKYGPFVMNDQKQIQQAFEDYQGGKNGFENAKTWKSQIRKLSQSFHDDSSDEDL